MKSDLKKEILEVFAETKDVHKTAEEMNLDIGIVRYHLKKEKIPFPKGAWAKNPDGKPLSKEHYLIGTKIAYLRHDGGITRPNEFANEVGISVRKYVSIEKGLTDATLSDLLRIARAFGKPLHELLEPVKQEQL